MKILVITFSRGLNPGTFMQAYGVKTGLLRIFPEAEIEYLRFPDFKRNLGVRGRNDSALSVAKQKMFAAYRLLKYRKLEKKHFAYTRSIDLFDYDEQEARDLLSAYDLIVVGSDTILEKAESDDHQRIGLNWNTANLCRAKHIFFAASASPARFADNPALLSQLKERVDKFSYIGLRDNLTINLFKDKLGVPAERIVKQPDPSYFLDVTRFRLGRHYADKLKGKKTVLCNFASNCPFRQRLADLLRKEGYYVVSTSYNPYADLSIDTIDATEWAGVFPLVNLVVTERFHDSVFALRNCKPVIAMDWDTERFDKDGDSKTFRILEEYGMERWHFNVTKEKNWKNIANNIKLLLPSFDKSAVERKNAEIGLILDSIVQHIQHEL